MVHFDITGSTGNDANFNSVQSKIMFQKKEKHLFTDNAGTPFSLRLIIEKFTSITNLGYPNWKVNIGFHQFSFQVLIFLKVKPLLDFQPKVSNPSGFKTTASTFLLYAFCEILEAREDNYHHLYIINTHFLM